jgi:hypothetical protein
MPVSSLAATEARLRRRARITELIRLSTLLLFVVFVWTQSYVGREQVVKNARAGCERAKLDRLSNGNGWRIAQDARRESGDLEVAKRYGVLATDLEARSRIDCAKAFPNASIFGFN